MNLNFKIFNPKENLGEVKSLRGHYHIMVDVSGSMYSTLPKLKEDIKVLMSNHLKPNDKLSIYWYSSRGEYGKLLDSFTLTDLSALESAKNSINWLSARNLTAFVECLELVNESIDKDCSNIAIFMSDGYENQNSKSLVISATEKLAQSIDYGLVIEYGNYANHELLVEMSNILGSFAFAKDVNGLSAILSSAVQNNYSPYEEIDLEAELGGEIDMAFCYVNDMPYQIKRADGAWKVPTGQKIYATLLSSGLSDEDVTVRDMASFAYLYQLLNNSKTVWEVLGKMGDVELIDNYGSSIGKQAVNNFLSTVASKINGSSDFFENGYRENYLPKEDAVCVLDVLGQLDGKVKVALRHSAFQYNRIGAKTVPEHKALTKGDIEKISEFSLVSEVKEFLGSKKGESFEYVEQRALSPFNLTYKTDSANISFRTVEDVTVEGIEEPLAMYRQYAIVKDLTLNIDNLIVTLTEEIKGWLKENFVNFLKIGSWGKDSEDIYIVELSGLPMTNRAMIGNIDANEFIKTHYGLLKLKYHQKALNYLIKDKETEGASKGVFNQKTVKLAGSDIYYANEITVKFDKIASLPSLSDKIKKFLGGDENVKLTLREGIFANCYKTYQNFSLESLYASIAKVRESKSWLEKKAGNFVIKALLSKQDLSLDYPEGKFTVTVDDNGDSFFDNIGFPEEISGTIVDKTVEVKF